MTHAYITGYSSRMWATAPETEGVACDVTDPVAMALCKYPHLRGLKPFELARALRVAPAAAQMGILNYAAAATGVRIAFEGISADDALSMAGRSAPKTELRFQDDAGSIMDQVIAKAKDHAPMIVVLAIVAAILAEAALREE